MKIANESAVLFECGDDTLVGVLHKAPSDNSTGILFVVGGPQYRVGSHRQFVLMARSFAAAGYSSLRFDYRGMGDSEGAQRSFQDIGDDIIAATEQFREQLVGLDSIIAIGLCDAASAILIHIRSLPIVRGMILMNPWVRTDSGAAQARLRHYYLRRIFQIGFWSKLAKGEVNVIRSIGEAVATASKAVAAAYPVKKTETSTGDYIDRMRDGLAASNMPVLLLISERDLTAQEFMNLVVSDQKWNQCTSRANIQVERLSEADHTFSRREYLDDACRQCAKWIAANYRS